MLVDVIMYSMLQCTRKCNNKPKNVIINQKVLQENIIENLTLYRY